MFEIDKPRFSDRITQVQNYKYHEIKYMGAESRCTELVARDILIFPFETEATGKVMTGIYLMKQFDLIADAVKQSVIRCEFNPLTDESNYDTVVRYLGDNMKISLDDGDINRLFYIGEIESSGKIRFSIPCYAINVTGKLGSKPDKRFEVDANLDARIEMVPYNAMIREVPIDCVIAAATMLMLTYLNS